MRFFSVSKGSPLRFYWSPPRNIRSDALYPNFWRYIRTILRFSKKEADARNMGFSWKRSMHDLNTAFWASDIVPTLDDLVSLSLTARAIVHETVLSMRLFDELLWSWNPRNGRLELIRIPPLLLQSLNGFHCLDSWYNQARPYLKPGSTITGHSTLIENGV